MPPRLLFGGQPNEIGVRKGKSTRQAGLPDAHPSFAFDTLSDFQHFTDFERGRQLASRVKRQRRQQGRFVNELWSSVDDLGSVNPMIGFGTTQPSLGLPRYSENVASVNGSTQLAPPSMRDDPEFVRDLNEFRLALGIHISGEPVLRRELLNQPKINKPRKKKRQKLADQVSAADNDASNSQPSKDVSELSSSSLANKKKRKKRSKDTQSTKKKKSKKSRPSLSSSSVNAIASSSGSLTSDTTESSRVACVCFPFASLTVQPELDLTLDLTQSVPVAPTVTSYRDLYDSLKGVLSDMTLFDAFDPHAPCPFTYANISPFDRSSSDTSNASSSSSFASSNSMNAMVAESSSSMCPYDSPSHITLDVWNGLSEDRKQRFTKLVNCSRKQFGFEWGNRDSQFVLVTMLMISHCFRSIKPIWSRLELSLVLFHWLRHNDELVGYFGKRKIRPVIELPRILPLFSYRIKKGPMRNLHIAYGFDPRMNSNREFTSRLQRFEVRLSKEVGRDRFGIDDRHTSSSYMFDRVSHHTQSNAAGENANSTPLKRWALDDSANLDDAYLRVKPIRLNASYQIAIVDDAQFQALVNEQELLDQFDLQTGWYSSLSASKMRKDIRNRIYERWAIKEADMRNEDDPSEVGMGRKRRKNRKIKSEKSKKKKKRRESKKSGKKRKRSEAKSSDVHWDEQDESEDESGEDGTTKQRIRTRLSMGLIERKHVGKDGFSEEENEEEVLVSDQDDSHGLDNDDAFELL